jgi:hypothetical protein
VCVGYSREGEGANQERGGGIVSPETQ